MSWIRERLGLILVGSVFIVLASFAIYVAIVTFPQPVDDPNPSRLTGYFTTPALWAVIFGFATYNAYTGRLFAGQRWNRMMRQLEDAGFRRASADIAQQTARIHAQVLSPTLLRTDRGGGIDYIAIGDVDGREVRCFRARLRGGGGVRRRIDAPVAAVRVDASFAPTLIRHRRSGIGPRRDMKRVMFESGRFNRSIEVYSADRFFATAIIDARMMEWLSGHLHRYTIEFADGWAVVSSSTVRGTVPSPLELVEFLGAMSSRIPRAVPSFFPRNDHVTSWLHKRSRRSLSRWLERIGEAS